MTDVDVGWRDTQTDRGGDIHITQAATVKTYTGGKIHCQVQ